MISRLLNCWKLNFFLLVFIITACQSAGDSIPEIEILHAPEFTMINGKPVAYYELLVRNRSKVSVRVIKLEVKDSKQGEVYLQEADTDLQKMLSLSGQHNDENKILHAGDSARIYIELTLPVGVKDAKIVHALTFECLHDDGTTTTAATTNDWDIHVQQPIPVGAPLRGGPWTAVYDPSWERGHRRVFYNVDGLDRIPGRYAVDFIRMDDNGKYARGEEDSTANWYGYGMDVLAVADGTVVAMRNDFNESQALSGHPHYPAEKATGNFITLDIGGDRYVFYEHLRPESVRVKIGQRVKKGDVIAALGFTGQTTGPHLHFHIADANSPLGAEGVPFAFENFILIGEYDDFGKFGKARWKDGDSPIRVTGERPPPNSVIDFLK